MGRTHSLMSSGYVTSVGRWTGGRVRETRRNGRKFLSRSIFRDQATHHQFVTVTY
jgi:hypothetical protein